MASSHIASPGDTSGHFELHNPSTVPIQATVTGQSSGTVRQFVVMPGQVLLVDAMGEDQRVDEADLQ